METDCINRNVAIHEIIVGQWIEKIIKNQCTVRDMIAAIPADVIPAPRWISVKDRLPELYQNVLVHYYNPHCVEPHNYAVAFRQNGMDEFIPGKNIWHVDSSPLALDRSDVTHWMPLPEPPREEGDEDGRAKTVSVPMVRPGGRGGRE